MKAVHLSEHRHKVLRKPQREIARRADCPQGQISKLERGHMPREWELQRYAEAYEVTVNRLIELIENARTWALPLLQFAEANEQRACVDRMADAARLKLEEAQLMRKAGAL